MASRMMIDRIALRALQQYHHATLNTFGDHETLVEAIQSRPGFFGPNPVAFLSLIARRPSICLSDLDEALINDRTLIRASAFRASLFLLCSADYPVYFRATRSVLQNAGMDRLQAAGITEIILARFTRTLEEANFSLAKSHDELIQILFPGVHKRPGPELERQVLRKLCDLGVLVRATAKGWKGNDFSYSLLKNWLSEISLSQENPESARTDTIRRYLRVYGPATLEDISWWTGLPLAQVQRSVAHLRREAVRFPVEGFKDLLIGLRESVDLIRKNPVTKVEIQFFPPWDPFTYGWLHRRRFVDKELMPWVCDAAGNISSVVVDSGRVIGLWQYRDSQTNVFEFHVFPQFVAKRKEVFQKAEEFAVRLAKISGADAVNIFERPLPTALNERPIGSFLWPLGKDGAPKPVGQPATNSPMERRTSNTFRSRYLDSENVVRPSESPFLAREENELQG